MRAAHGSDSLGLRAIGLMAAWRRATAAHMALPGGISCACGSAFDGLSAAVLERDLVIYVYEKHRASEVMRPVFESIGHVASGGCDLARLVRAIIECQVIGAAETRLLLDDLDNAIRGLSQGG